MEATVTYKKKIIDLKEDTFKALSVMAARQGTNLKKLIESLLDKTAEEYDDSEAYRYMSEKYPDGKVKLEKSHFLISTLFSISAKWAILLEQA